MEQVFTFDFPELSIADRVQLQRALRGQKAQLLCTVLDKVNSPEVSERLGEQVSDVQRFFSELIFYSKGNPDLFWQITDHWATGLLLSRLLNQYDHQAEPEQVEKIISSLNGLLLFDRLLNGSSSDAPAEYVTRVDAQGRVHGLMHDTSLEFLDERFRGKRLVWSCTADEATVSVAGGGVAGFTVALPALDNAHFRFVPLVASKALELPIVEESQVWGKLHENGAGRHPLTMEESLTGAQEIIRELWPEALEWIDAIVPAFVDMGVPPAGTTRLSSSFNPGAPIFLGRVNEPFAHAEDVVHEVQHHRLLLIAGPSHFKSWSDPTEVYVSPYRPDPRPLRGLILGIHAFLTANELKKRFIERGQGGEALVSDMADTHYKNLFTYRTVIEHEEFSAYGTELFRQMGRLMAEHHEFIKSGAPADAERVAEGKLRGHVSKVGEQAAGLKNSAPLYRDWDETARLAANFG